MGSGPFGVWCCSPSSSSSLLRLHRLSRRLLPRRVRASQADAFFVAGRAGVFFASLRLAFALPARRPRFASLDLTGRSFIGATLRALGREAPFLCMAET